MMVAVVLASCGTSHTVPITGRTQSLMVEDGQVLGLATQQYQEFMKTAKLSTNAANTAMVKRVGQNLANAVTNYMTANGLASEIANFNWTFNLVQDKQVNAWCMPGGLIVVYEGILPVTQDEASLAIVLGHEIAHAVARHSAEQMSTQMKQQQGLQVGAAVAGMLGMGTNTTSLIGAVVANGFNFKNLSYSRSHESEADHMGLIFAALAGYDPQTAITFWQRMASQSSNKTSEFLSDHPSDETRIRQIQGWMPEALQYYKKGGATKTTNYKDIRMKKTIICVLGVASLTMAHAQTKPGGLSSEMLRDIQKEQKAEPVNRALVNAVAANSIDALTVNHQNAGALDTYFSIETPKQSITDQKSSGRCWMFSGLNVLRSNYTKERDSIQVEFSQAYLFFWDQLEKANLMLQGCVDTGHQSIDDPRVQFFFKSPIGDGGTFCGVADLVDKYGLVPAEVMPETYTSDNTSKARALISSKLREYGLQLRDMAQKDRKQNSIDKAKTRMLSQIYKMLVMTIGEPPQQFTYAFKDKNGKAVGPAKTYTPQTFSQEVVGGPINGTFIMAMNDPRRPYYKTYEVEYDRHTYDGHNWKYVNLPMEDIEQMAIASLKDGRKLYSSYDVGKFLDRKRGYADTDNFDYASSASPLSTAVPRML